MNRMRGFARYLGLPLAAALLWAAVPGGVARAGLVTTEEVVSGAVADRDRARVAAYLAREDVRSQLRGLGVDPEEARSRVAALTDTEIRRIAGELDRMPAGGDGLGSLVGAAVFVFLVLLITDIAGLTDVFPFVKKR